MTDKEFEAILEEVAGERSEKEQVFDARFCEREEGKTPNGGDYSVAYYYDEDGNPVESAPHPQQKLFVDLGEKIEMYDLLRRAEMAGE